MKNRKHIQKLPLILSVLLCQTTWGGGELLEAPELPPSSCQALTSSHRSDEATLIEREENAALRQTSRIEEKSYEDDFENGVRQQYLNIYEFLAGERELKEKQKIGEVPHAQKVEWFMDDASRRAKKRTDIFVTNDRDEQETIRTIEGDFVDYIARSKTTSFVDGTLNMTNGTAMLKRATTFERPDRSEFVDQEEISVQLVKQVLSYQHDMTNGVSYPVVSFSYQDDQSGQQNYPGQHVDQSQKIQHQTSNTINQWANNDAALSATPVHDVFMVQLDGQRQVLGQKNGAAQAYQFQSDARQLGQAQVASSQDQVFGKQKFPTKVIKTPELVTTKTYTRPDGSAYIATVNAPSGRFRLEATELQQQKVTRTRYLDHHDSGFKLFSGSWHKTYWNDYDLYAIQQRQKITAPDGTVTYTQWQKIGDRHIFVQSGCHGGQGNYPGDPYGKSSN